MTDETKPARPRRRRRWFFRAILIACGVVLVGGASFVVALALLKDRPEVEVPDVRGLAVDEARAKIEPLGLTVEIVRGYHPGGAEGVVFLQEPAAGSQVRPPRRVLLRVCAGAEPITVPDVVGLPLLEARSRLERAGTLAFGRGGGFGVEVRAEVADETAPPGLVLEQDPPAGASLVPGETVGLVVSAGPAGHGRYLADLRGRTLDEAESILAGIGVKALDVVRVPVGPERAGLVVGQTPPPGTPAPEARTVHLEVGVGVAPEEERRASIVYAVPAGETPPREVVIDVIDDDGKREVYRGTPEPGAQVTVPVRVRGQARARLIVGGRTRDEWAL